MSTTALPDGLTPAEIDAEVRARVHAGEDLYHLDEGAFRDLDPDLVVTQDLCAVCAVDVANVEDAIEYLGCGASIVTLDPMTLGAVFESIEHVGAATGAQPRARELVCGLEARVAAVERAVRGRPEPRVAVLEWTDPPFASGHWVPDMVAAAGGVSVFGDSGRRSAQTDWQALHRAEPDVIVVAPCGYHLDGARALAEGVVAAGVLPERVPVWAVDADASFVRPGPRVVDGIETLAAIAHVDVPGPGAHAAVLVRA